MTDPQPEAPALSGVTRWRNRATVEAIQWCGHNLAEVQLFCGTLVYPAAMTEGPAFKVDEGDSHAVVWVTRRGLWEWAPQGCWIVSEPHGVRQSLAPVAADAFAATYEPADGPQIDAAGSVPDDTGRPLATRDGQPRERAGASTPDPREPLGRIVREVWVTYVRATIPGPKPSWTAPWDELDGFQREADMRIGAAVAAAERDRIRQMAIRNQAVCTGDEGTSCYFADLIQGPGPADPETPLSDALHTLGQVRRLAESMAMSGGPAERDCGRRVLAVIGAQGDMEPAPQERSDEKGDGNGQH